MIGYYKKSREEIAKIIQESPITDDGYYFCKKFRSINEQIGEKLDKDYYFKREMFKNKICFTLDDIDAYLTKNKSKFNIDDMKKLDDFLYNLLIKDIETYGFEDKVENNSFTLKELIDCSIFMFYNKYNK